MYLGHDVSPCQCWELLVLGVLNLICLPIIPGGVNWEKMREFGGTTGSSNTNEEEKAGKVTSHRSVADGLPTKGHLGRERGL